MLETTRLKDRRRKIRPDVTGKASILAGGSRWYPPDAGSRWKSGDLVFVMFSGSTLLVYDIDPKTGDGTGEPEAWREST